ncbi:MAG: hypothetical protein V2A74_07790 [bacterium]
MPSPSFLELCREVLIEAGWPRAEMLPIDSLRLHSSAGGEEPLTLNHFSIRLHRHPFVWAVEDPGEPFVPFASIYPRYLDFEEKTGCLLAHARRREKFTFLLVGTESSFLLYDIARSEAVLHADDAATSRTEMLKFFQCLLSAGRCPPHLESGRDPTQRSEELKLWRQLWSANLGGLLKVSPQTVESWFQKFLFLRHFELKDFLPVTARGLESLSPFAISQRDLGAEPATWREFWLDYLLVTSKVYGGPIFAADEVDRALFQSPAALSRFQRLAYECRQVSPEKFQLDCLVDSFAEPELQQQDWKHSVLDAPVSEESFILDGVYPHRPLRVELARTGYKAVLKSFRGLLDWLVSVEEEQRVFLKSEGFWGHQSDLWSDMPDGLSPEGLLTDIPVFALSAIFRVHAPEENRRSLVRFGLAASLASFCQENKRMLPTLELIEKVWD